MTRIFTHTVAALAISAFCVSLVSGQSSSLFVTNAQEAATPTAVASTDAVASPTPVAAQGVVGTTNDNVRGVENRLSPAIAQVSLTAVKLPEPRAFSVQDLVTIVVRESTEADSDSTLDTSKKTKTDAGITAFPNLNLEQLLAFQLAGGALTNPPRVKTDSTQNFKGEGDYKRRDTFTTRITARIIDVKPNGTLVLEARKHIKSDKESLEMVLTGTCRKEDVTADNTLLSTQIYDLRLDKKHTGEVRGATKKGVITKALELLFNF